MLLNCGVGENSWESLDCKEIHPVHPKGVQSWVFIGRTWYWSWNSNILATSWEELTHWKRPWCWERLRAGGEGDNKGWDGWMASPTQWTWVWVDLGSWWWTGRPGVLWFMGSKRVRHDWVTELNWSLEATSSKSVSSLVGRKPYHWCFLDFVTVFVPFPRPSISVVVQSLSLTQLYAIPWTAAHQASLSFTISWSFLKLMSIE